MFILDSSAIIELLKDNERGKKILAKIGEENIATTSIIVHELFSGADEKNKFIIKNILSRGKVFDFSYEDAEISGKIERFLSDKGELINKLDILIAGTCMRENAILVTFDKDFKKIPDLKLLEI